ncbi:MAG: hypothetical protein ABIK93_02825 [candidate division WOR-3 bacterium]
MLRILLIFSLIFVIGLSSDIGVTKILAPTGIIPPDNYTPRAQLKNYGDNEESCWVYFRITTLNGNPIYFDSNFIHLTGNATENVSFRTWTAITGVYIDKCSLYLSSDTNPMNDTFTARVRVENLIPGEWYLRDSVPYGESGKKVKDGAGLTDGSKRGEKLIYVLKGNNTNEIYLYDVILGTWQTKRSVPYSQENPDKRPKKGSCLFRSGNYVYLAKGNNTLEFWGYYIPDDTWTRLKDIPLGLSGKALKGGSSLTEGKIGNQKYLFLTKGSGTREFYAYNPNSDTWIEKASTPYFDKESKGKIKKGSCLVSDGENVYLLRDKTNWLFFYDCDSNKWYPRESLPFYGRAQKKAKVKDGASMAYQKGNPDIIYAFKGGGNEFWCYSVDDDSWVELTSLPLLPSNKKVKGGGSLLSIAGGIFALKGGNTNELWMYVPTDTIFTLATNLNYLNILNQDLKDIKTMEFNQLPINDELTIFNALGRKVKVSATKEDIKRLKSGIYFITHPRAKPYNFRKIVIIH